MVLRSCAVLAFVASLLLLLSSCGSSPGGGSHSGATAGEMASTQWVLSGIELRRDLLPNLGRLPVFRRTSGFSGNPFGSGTLAVSPEGKAVVRVEFFEPAGHGNPLRYEVMNFSGFYDASKDKIVQYRENTGTSPGIATEVRTSLSDEGILTAHGFHNGQGLPYIFKFAPQGATRGVVAIPTID